ncbi:hypothetical protein ACLOJK_020240 [Asimina triloba]
MEVALIGKKKLKDEKCYWLYTLEGIPRGLCGPWEFLGGDFKGILLLSIHHGSEYRYRAAYRPPPKTIRYGRIVSMMVYRSIFSYNHAV